MKRERVDVYDIAKGIGIICIVLGHLLHIIPREDPMYMFIYNFHVPLFILVSGCVMKVEGISFREYVSKRFTGIVIPYVVASIFAILHLAVPQGGYWIHFDSILIGTAQGGGLSYNVALWYCTMIFVACVWFYLIATLADKTKKKEIILPVLVLVSAVIGYLLVVYEIRLPWNVETALIAQIFLYAGYKIKGLIKNTYEKKTYLYIAIAFVVLSIIYMFTFWRNGLVDMNNGVYYNVPLYLLNAGVGIALVFLVSILIRRIPGVWHVLAYLGRNSLYIMLFHLPAVTFAQGRIVGYLPEIVQNHFNSRDIIGITYWVVVSILFSLFWGYVYKAIMKTK